MSATVELVQEQSHECLMIMSHFLPQFYFLSSTILQSSLSHNLFFLKILTRAAHVDNRHTPQQVDRASEKKIVFHEVLLSVFA